MLFSSNRFRSFCLQQSAWQQAVGEIKVDVENKLDRMELDPLKAYLDKRIKAANAKVVRKEPELVEDAAGFRKWVKLEICAQLLLLLLFIHNSDST